MIPTANFLAVLVTLFVRLILPVILLIVYAVKNKGKGIWSAWFLGAAGFFVSQILIRVPILSVLQTQEWFLTFAQEHYWLYAFLLAFTAGLFELAGRFAVAKLMKKGLTCQRSLAAGLGHGGIEAMIITGMTYVNNLLYMLMIQTGTFDTVIAQAAAAGVDPSQLTAIQDALINTSAGMFLLGGFELILAMIAHAGMSMIVCYGVHTKRPVPALLLCLGIHTFIDTTAGISGLATDAMGSVLSQNAAYALIFTILTIVAVISILIMKNIRSRWAAESTPNHGGAL